MPFKKGFKGVSALFSQLFRAIVNVEERENSRGKKGEAKKKRPQSRRKGD